MKLLEIVHRNKRVYGNMPKKEAKHELIQRMKKLHSLLKIETNRVTKKAIEYYNGTHKSEFDAWVFFDKNKLASEEDDLIEILDSGRLEFGGHVTYHVEVPKAGLDSLQKFNDYLKNKIKSVMKGSKINASSPFAMSVITEGKLDLHNLHVKPEVLAQGPNTFSARVIYGYHMYWHGIEKVLDMNTVALS